MPSPFEDPSEKALFYQQQTQYKRWMQWLGIGFIGVLGLLYGLCTHLEKQLNMLQQRNSLLEEQLFSHPHHAEVAAQQREAALQARLGALLAPQRSFLPLMQALSQARPPGVSLETIFWEPDLTIVIGKTHNPHTITRFMKPLAPYAVQLHAIQTHTDTEGVTFELELKRTV